MKNCTILYRKESFHLTPLSKGAWRSLFQKGIQSFGGFPIHVSDIKGKNAIRSRDYLVPHVEEGGDFVPNGGMLASLQGSPQDLMCGDQGTTHVLSVPLLRRCETMETQGGSRENTQHH